MPAEAATSPGAALCREVLPGCPRLGRAPHTAPRSRPRALRGGGAGAALRRGRACQRPGGSAAAPAPLLLPLRNFRANTDPSSSTLRRRLVSAGLPRPAGQVEGGGDPRLQPPGRAPPSTWPRETSAGGRGRSRGAVETGEGRRAGAAERARAGRCHPPRSGAERGAPGAVRRRRRRGSGGRRTGAGGPGLRGGSGGPAVHGAEPAGPGAGQRGPGGGAPAGSFWFGRSALWRRRGGRTSC